MNVVEKGIWSTSVECACCHSKLEVLARDVKSEKGEALHVVCRVCGTHCAMDDATVPPKVEASARKKATKGKS